LAGCDRRDETETQLEEALDAGEMNELPPNAPRGILGERGFDIYKVDEYEPDLNSGISQENDLPVVWLAIVLAYLVFFPVAYWLMWRTPLISHRYKVIASAVGAIGVVFVVIALMLY